MAAERVGEGRGCLPRGTICVSPSISTALACSFRPRSSDFMACSASLSAWICCSLPIDFWLGGHFYLFCGALMKLIRHLATLIAKVETLLGLFQLIPRGFMIVLHFGHTLLEVAGVASNITACA